MFTSAALALATVQAAIGNEAGVEAFAENLYQFGISATGGRRRLHLAGACCKIVARQK